MDAGTKPTEYYRDQYGTHPIFGLPPGVIFPYGGATAPSAYLLCDGASYLRTEYPALFAVIGTAFGAVDGTHFNVPDLRGQFLRGRDGGAGIDPDAANRTALKAGGATGDNVGSKQVTATKLPLASFTTGNQSASHNHNIGGSGTLYSNYTNPSHYHVTGYASDCSAAPSYGKCCTTNAWRFDLTSGNRCNNPKTNTASINHRHSINSHGHSCGNQNASHTHTITGGGDSESRPPNVYVNFIIKT